MHEFIIKTDQQSNFEVYILNIYFRDTIDELLPKPEDKEVLFKHVENITTII